MIIFRKHAEIPYVLYYYIWYRISSMNEKALFYQILLSHSTFQSSKTNSLLLNVFILR